MINLIETTKFCLWKFSSLIKFAKLCKLIIKFCVIQSKPKKNKENFREMFTEKLCILWNPSQEER